MSAIRQPARIAFTIVGIKLSFIASSATVRSALLTSASNRLGWLTSHAKTNVPTMLKASTTVHSRATCQSVLRSLRVSSGRIELSVDSV